MEAPALPARLWPEGSEIMRADLTFSRETDEFGVLCFPGGFNADVELRIQHANVIFAFQRYLRGYAFIFQAAEKEVSRADVNHCKFSIRDSGPSQIHVLIGTLSLLRERSETVSAAC